MIGRFKRAFRAFFAEEPAAIEPKENGHLRLLALLQKHGRLLDFLQEDISGYSDAQVGQAVRQLHADCKHKLEELVALRPVMERKEGEEVEVAEGFDPSSLRLVGKGYSKLPVKGVLVHPGWRAEKQSLPTKIGEGDVAVLAPAEIEVR